MTFAALGAINAQPENVFARLIGSVAPGRVEATALKRAEDMGKLQFELALFNGATITYDTTSSQLDLMLGRLANGVVPRRPLELPNWLANERQELHGGGLQIAGPFRQAQAARLAVSVDEGSDFQYGTACADAAQSAVARLASGQAQVGACAASTRFMTRGQRYFGPLNPPPCDWVLVTYSQGDADVTVGVVP